MLAKSNFGAVTNSYGHRTYGNNQCNEIDVFKNRIEIHTTGGFPKGHDPAEFLDGNKKAIRRNKLMTRVLYFSKDMETFATGLKRIKDLCDEAGCKVEFRTEKDDFVVAFYRNLREEWNNLGGNTTQTTTQTTQNTTQSSVLVLSEIEGRIIRLLQSNPTASQGMIAEELEMDVNNIKYYVNKLKKQGVL